MEPDIKQVTRRLSDLVDKLHTSVNATERRELLSQFRELLDQADKLNAGAFSSPSGSNDSAERTN